MTFEGKQYRGRLVDLPCILESHKTFDSKQFYKIADVCQMLVVEDLEVAAANEKTKTKDKGKQAADGTAAQQNYFWKHGLTPPMRNVRKKRFRRRAARV